MMFGCSICTSSEHKEEKVIRESELLDMSKALLFLLRRRTDRLTR